MRGAFRGVGTRGPRAGPPQRLCVVIALPHLLVNATAGSYDIGPFLQTRTWESLPVFPFLLLNGSLVSTGHQLPHLLESKLLPRADRTLAAWPTPSFSSAPSGLDANISPC